MPTRKELECLLDELCLELGFCLPSAARETLIIRSPQEADTFANAVIELEGLNPERIDRHLYRQVRALVAKAYGSSVCARLR